MIIWISALIGCGKQAPSEVETKRAVTVYTTLFPLYDFTRQIGGEFVEVHNVIPAGVDGHDFEPKAKDVIAIHDADIFIYNGAGYEAWVDNVVRNLDQQQTIVIDASATIALRAGHAHDTEDAHDDHDDHNHDAHEGHSHGVLDPHTWLDPMNAKMQGAAILAALIDRAPQHEAAFTANYMAYAAQLDALDRQYREALATATKREVVVSHQAFGYLADRYGFLQIPISGLSPSSEPSTKELQRLIELLREHDLTYIAFDGLVDSKIARTVQRETGAQAVTLYTIENVTKAELEQGVTYIDLMEENLAALKKVLEVR